MVSGKRVDLMLQDVFLGKLDAELEILNYFITPVKLHICIIREHGVTPNLSVFKEIVKVKFKTNNKVNNNNNLLTSIVRVP